MLAQRAEAPGPQSIPDAIERERVEIDVDPELRVCSCCKVELQRIGEDVTTEIDHISSRVST